MRLRLGTIKKEIEVKGHYDLTYEELVFGARTAWRNAPRCINRIIWRQLEVLGGDGKVGVWTILTTNCIARSWTRGMWSLLRRCLMLSVITSSMVLMEAT